MIHLKIVYPECSGSITIFVIHCYSGFSSIYLLRRMPFLDKFTKNIYLQHYVNWVNEVFVYVVFYSTNFISLFFYIGISLYINAMLKDLIIFMQTIDADMQNQQNTTKGEIQRKLFDAIQFHVNLFDLADTIADIMSLILFIMLVMYAIIIALLLIALDASYAIDNEFFIKINGLNNILIPLAIYCTLSENVTVDLIATGNVFYTSCWYLLPDKLQKLYVLSISRSQKEYRLMGLGIVECSLRTFVSVRHFLCDFMKKKR